MLGEYDVGYENYIDSLIREIEKLQDENDKLSEQVSSLVGRSFRTADKMSCIEAENAKLREQSERLFDKTLELATENSKLRELCKLCECEAENAKLQNDAELLRAMLSQVQTEKRCYMAENAKLRTFIGLKEACWKYVGWCDECPYNGVDDEHDDCNCTVHEKINSLARELEIEVDDA